MKGMIKSLFLLLAVLVATPLWATTYTAASCSAADVQTAVNSAANGDTVLVPQSTCTGGVTWNYGSGSTPALTVPSTKWIILNGQGVNVNIGCNSSLTNTPMIVINSSTSGNTRFTGFTLSGNGADRSATKILNNAGAQTIRFDNNTVTDASCSGPQAIMLNLVGDGPALIDHNTFTTYKWAEETIHNHGTSLAGYNPSYTWSTDIIPGGSNFVFIEDNTFNGPVYSGEATQAIENFDGAKVVFRHNHMHDMDFDTHGYCQSQGSPCQYPNEPNSCDFANTRWYEVYSNDMYVGAGASASNVINLRGGSGVIYNNTMSAPAGQTYIQFQADCNPTSAYVSMFPYPYLRQPGTGINSAHSPIYVWGNTGFQGASGGFNISQYQSYIAVNREYYSVSSGTGITRCESAADVTTGCPVTYNYTAYTYPHPLISGGGGGGTLTQPTISPLSGGYPTPQTVSITGPVGATICYRTDGLSPAATTPGTCDAGSSTYSSSFSLTIPGFGADVTALSTQATYTNSSVSLNAYALVNCNNTSLGGGWTCNSAANAGSPTSVATLTTKNFPSNPPSGSLIFVFQLNGSNTACSTPTDTLGTTFTSISSTTLAVNSEIMCDYYGVVGTGGVDAVTCLATTLRCAATNVSGQATSSIIDKTCTRANAITSTGSNNATCSASITPTNNNELILASSFGDSLSSTIAAGTNFTLTSGTDYGRQEHYMQATAAAITPSQTIDSSSNYAFLAASLNSASAPATPSVSGLSPVSGFQGTPVYINGSGFGASQGTSTVTFNGVVATCPSWGWTSTQIACYAPPGGSGNLVVTVSGATSNPIQYTLVHAPNLAPGVF